MEGRGRTNRRVKLCVYSGLKYGRDSEKRQAASFFCRLFSPVSTSTCVAIRASSPLSQIKEEWRSYAPLRPLFDWIFTAKKKGRERKPSSLHSFLPSFCPKPRYSARTCTIILEYLRRERRCTSDDTLKITTFDDKNVSPHLK